MYKHIKMKSFGDFFNTLNERNENGVFFYRIHSYNSDIDAFLRTYYETARTNGVVIEGRIQNPTEQNLGYYEEMMGNDFTLSSDFISSHLKKWMSRLTPEQNTTLSTAICQSLDTLKQNGKNDSMIKNAYIKIMCWLYYRFERIVSRLGDQNVPKVLYIGNISHYELIMLHILSVSGTDIVLLEYDGDGDYLKVDPGSVYSNILTIQGSSAFPPGFDLKQVPAKQPVANMKPQPTKPEPNLPFRTTITLHSNRKVQDTAVTNQQKTDTNQGTNEWLKNKENIFEAIKMPVSSRGNDSSRIYNCFIRMHGVEDRLTYQNELYGIYQAFQSDRNMIVIDDTIPSPTTVEIESIKRKNTYQSKKELLIDLMNNIVYPSVELQTMVRKSFAHVMDIDEPINKLINIGVTLLCYIKRYSTLFRNWKKPDIECFIHFGPCKNNKEALFLSCLARLPTDVVILVPNLNDQCVLHDELLLEKKYTIGMELTKFPKDINDIQIATTAYHAEKDLSTLIYQNSGIYKPNQFKKANSLTMKTMYEEIPILWNQEVKYRPNFSTTEIVNIPVIFAKISGVKKVNAYWKQVRELSQGAYLKVESYIERNHDNPFITYAGSFIRGGNILRDKIKEHPSYRYGFLRMDMQEHIFDKMQLLLDRNIIKGTGDLRTNSIIIASILNMDQNILRMLQNFDFTRKNPKVVYVNTGERMPSIEDAVVIAFLNLVGFDIVMFIPTGYACVENYYNDTPFEEHLIGDYAYDLQIPDLSQQKKPFIKKLFS